MNVAHEVHTVNETPRLMQSLAFNPLIMNWLTSLRPLGVILKSRFSPLFSDGEWPRGGGARIEPAEYDLSHVKSPPGTLRMPQPYTA